MAFNPQGHLPILPKGKLPANHYAGVTRAANAKALQQNGYRDGDGSATRPETKKPRIITVYSAIAVPVNSVFEIVGLRGTSKPDVYEIAQYDPVARSTHIYCTNQWDSIDANTYGVATIIPPDDSVYIDGSSFSPALLTSFGPLAGSFNLSSDNTGLICLGAPDARGMIPVCSISNGNKCGCNCKDCAPLDSVLITDYSGCNASGSYLYPTDGAAPQWSFNPGTWDWFPALGGNQIVSWYATGSYWRSDGTIKVYARNWVVNTVYFVGMYVQNGSKLYVCSTISALGFRSAFSGSGPSGTGTGIVDGGVKWDYVDIVLYGRYYWRFNLTYGGGALFPQFASPGVDHGYDVVQAGGSTYAPSYNVEAKANCLCERKAELVFGSSDLNSPGIECSICVKPVGVSCCSNCWQLTLPEISFIGLEQDGTTVIHGASITAQTITLPKYTAQVGVCQWHNILAVSVSGSGYLVNGGAYLAVTGAAVSGLTTHAGWVLHLQVGVSNMSEGWTYHIIFGLQSNADNCNQNLTVTFERAYVDYGSGLEGTVVLYNNPSEITLPPVDCGSSSSSSSSSSSGGGGGGPNPCHWVAVPGDSPTGFVWVGSGQDTSGCTVGCQSPVGFPFTGTDTTSTPCA